MSVSDRSFLSSSLRFCCGVIKLAAKHGVPSDDDALPRISKLLPQTGAVLYTTMEPCSIRTSGLAPCADALIAAKIRRCFIGVGEPDDFVNCEGAQKLKNAGVEVIWINGLEKECLEVARTGH